MSGISEAKNNVGDRPYLVFLCSAFILPGLGQVISGQRVKGLIMAGITTLWTALAGAYFMWRTSQISGALAAMGELPSLTAYREGLAPYASQFLTSLVILVCIWLWSASDALIWSRSRALSRKSAADNGN